MIFFIFIFRFFSPVGMVPVIALTGFGLFNRGFPVVCLSLKIEESSLLGFLFWLCVLCLQVGTCVEIGIPMLILFVLFSQVIIYYLCGDHIKVSLIRLLNWSLLCFVCVVSEELSVQTIPSSGEIRYDYSLDHCVGLRTSLDSEWGLQTPTAPDSSKLQNRYV